MNTNKVFARFFNFFRRYQVRENRITLIEKLNTSGTGSLYELQKECRRRGFDFEYNVITQADYALKLSNLPGLLRLFTWKVYRMATSSHVFMNDNFLPLAYMDVAPETRVVQLWHGMGSFKKFGASSETDPALLQELKAANEKVDYILATSENIRANYAEAFCVPEDKILVIGCPQGDYYFRKHNLAPSRAKLEKWFPVLKGKKLALYAPTFRDDEDRDRDLLTHFDFERFNKELGKEYCLALRLHPQVQTADIPENVVNLTDYPNLRRLLCMTDLLIADYSSIAVEYSLLGKPIVFYAFDKDWYLEKDRQFYFDYEKTAPGPITETMEDLISCIRSEGWDLDKVKAFAHLHNDFFDCHSAERLVDFCFGDKTREEQ